MKTWSFTDKSNWKPGPWNEEPDKAHWIHEGLDCLIVRGPSGALCGYVGVPPSHPAYGKEYNYFQGRFDETSDDYVEPEHRVEVHGGLTFSDKCTPGEPIEGICHSKEDSVNEDVHWFGFDCAHLGDYCPKYSQLEDRLPHLYRRGVDHYWTLAEVKRETEYLAEQLARIAQ